MRQTRRVQVHRIASTGSMTTAWDNRNSFGGTETLLSSEMGFSGFGLYADATSDLSISLPIACYTLDGMERAIARQAKANSAFWTAVGSHQPHGTQLADPDIDIACTRVARRSG